MQHLQSAPLRRSVQMQSPSSVDQLLTTSSELTLSSKKLPDEGLELYLENIEKEILLNALNITHCNRTLAAKKLGMSFRSLRYRLKKFGLDTDE